MPNNKENKPVNVHSTSQASYNMNKTQSVLEGKRSTNNGTNSSSTSITRGTNGPMMIEKPPAKSVRDKSENNVRHKYQPHSIREPNKSASSSGVGMFAKDYNTVQN